MKKYLLLFFLVTAVYLSAAPSNLLQLEDGFAREYLIEDQWHLFDEKLNSVYLNLDNETIANYDQLVDDPFLIIRTKVGGPESNYNVAASWYNYTRFSPFKLNIIEQEDKTPCGTIEACYESPLADPLVVFSYESPRFDIGSDSEIADKIWWQIGSDQSFNQLVPNCDRVQNYDESIYLDRISETFLKPSKVYFFRYRYYRYGEWEDWTDPITFTYLKPNAPTDLVFEKLGNQCFQIRWGEDPDSAVSYWVFGSNALDFIPSIYCDYQINALVENQVLAAEDNNNLITITQNPYVQVDGTYSFYRIIAEKNNAFSVPSPIIRVYDEAMEHQRTVLTRDALVDGIAKRILFPPDAAVKDVKTKKWEANVKHPLVTDDVWNTVTPYLMPLNHPIRAQLDRLFSSTRVLLDGNSISRAGFTKSTPAPFSKAIIAQHNKIGGYFFKMFSDSQPNVVDWEQWVRRAYGAASARSTIVQHHLTKHFVVPHKWIYPLPPEPSPPEQYSRKFFILVAEKIKIEDKEKNYKMWKKNMTRERLRAIVFLLHKEGLTDSNRAFNIPFAKDGRNALIDLEHNHHWPVHFDALKHWLTPQMSAYLNQLKLTIAN